MLRCPLCKNTLSLDSKSYTCSAGHNFDKAKQGYVNLLVGGKKVGDDAMMVEARRAFLETGLYAHLIEYIAGIINNEKESYTIADIGCGEGRYMRELQTRRNNNNDTYLGIDISKDAVKYASKKTAGTFVVGNAYDLPLQDSSFDYVISIFSPFDESEIKRCLKPGGEAIIVSPGKHHLYKFIEMIWDSPHHHIITPPEEKYSLLSVDSSHDVLTDLSLESNNDIASLFKMTPYYRKAPKVKQEKILGLQTLETQTHFVIDVLSNS